MLWTNPFIDDVFYHVCHTPPIALSVHMEQFMPTVGVLSIECCGMYTKPLHITDEPNVLVQYV